MTRLVGSHLTTKSLTTTSPNSVKNYELLVIFAGSLKESDREAALAKWEKEVGLIGKIENKVVWTARALAYKIKRGATGTYLILHFAGDPTKIAELNSALRIEPSVIRHLIYTTPKHYEWREYEPSDLEYDLVKIRASADEDAEAKTELTKVVEKKIATAKPASTAAAIQKTTPSAKSVDTGKDRPAVKKEVNAKNSEENKKKLDSLLDEL